MEEMQKIINYHKDTRKWQIGMIVVIGVIFIALYLFFSGDSKQMTYRYVTEALKKNDLSLTVSASGYIQPLESVDVGTEVSGTIDEVYVDYNDQVKKGQLLASLDTTKYQSAYDRAKAALQISKAALESARAQQYQAETTMERYKELKRSSGGTLPTQSDWDREWANYLLAKAQIANAQAQIDQAGHALKAAEYDLERTKIYSPVDGTILVRNVDPGQTVAATFQTPVLFNIAKDLSRMELQISIDEADIGKIAAGQKANFSVDAYPDTDFNTSIRQVRINSEILESVVTYKAIMDVKNANLLLKPGMSVDADIVTKTLNDAFVVKRAALLFIPVEPQSRSFFGGERKRKIKVDPKPHVWILKEGVPTKVYVKVLGNNGPLSAIESKELQEGDKIIINQEKAS
ncbi:efflux RND transporter periplasmic adaptor subunit [Sulfurovum sp.]|jgi:HlyD family secretion protein|uniref:efflux RND transporter periplasmic adaptor subunit n=1 Tax=Sulfurovum sp. TaxID=1969726 RepID=UPI002A36BFD3|nr:efflux RND transporter periplasmic adaptor subunit [Sulfurovum sp.]MDD2450933.1 efflux RND transporter periplasmic adaptor subunit [Sulfurovum sp.]MDD3499050.1 efflux RND transporter periplasmic adaptor subunit [Sulfurovum sp.]MDY0403170.1 efflux RND transporter periplasmic adaptor subunit [Sulfurovum sp.]